MGRDWVQLLGVLNASLGIARVRLGVLVLLLAVASGADAQVAIRDAAATAPPNISAGGQVREQYERFQHEDWAARHRMTTAIGSSATCFTWTHRYGAGCGHTSS